MESEAGGGRGSGERIERHLFRLSRRCLLRPLHLFDLRELGLQVGEDFFLAGHGHDAVLSEHGGGAEQPGEHDPKLDGESQEDRPDGPRCLDGVDFHRDQHEQAQDENQESPDHQPGAHLVVDHDHHDAHRDHAHAHPDEQADVQQPDLHHVGEGRFLLGNQHLRGEPHAQDADGQCDEIVEDDAATEVGKTHGSRHAGQIRQSPQTKGKELHAVRAYRKTSVQNNPNVNFSDD